MELSLSRFFQSKPNILLFRCAPAGLCFAYLQALGRVYYLFRRKEGRLIETNIRDLLQDRPERFVRRTIKQTYRGIFSHYYEKMFSAFKGIPSIRRMVKKRFTLHNESIILEALKQGRGVILVTAHWGAVEFIPWVLGIHGFPLSVILECVTAHLEQALSQRAKCISAELITSDSDGGVFYQALGSLKRNRVLMTECDEVDRWRKRKNQTIDLFGRRLYFDNTLDILARRANAPVVGVFLRRITRNSYSLVCEPISLEQPGVETARTALSLWQKYVIRYPHQWYQWKKWALMKAAA